MLKFLFALFLVTVIGGCVATESEKPIIAARLSDDGIATLAHKKSNGALDKQAFTTEHSVGEYGPGTELAQKCLARSHPYEPYDMDLFINYSDDKLKIAEKSLALSKSWTVRMAQGLIKAGGADYVPGFSVTTTILPESRVRGFNKLRETGLMCNYYKYGGKTYLIARYGFDHKRKRIRTSQYHFKIIKTRIDKVHEGTFYDVKFPEAARRDPMDR